MVELWLILINECSREEKFPFMLLTGHVESFAQHSDVKSDRGNIMSENRKFMNEQ